MAVPLFDSYVMVDWSAKNGRGGGKSDSIWIAFGRQVDREPVTESPRSRTEAEQAIRSLLEPFVRSEDGRVLVCADFGYGYPAGFASLLGKSLDKSVDPWRAVWMYLEERLQDDLGTKPGWKPSNCSNRFDVANAINVAASTAGSRGPFWCAYPAGRHPCVPQSRPTQPFAGQTSSRRITDARAKSDTPFRLFGTGSVGSQILTGVPRLESLRFDPEFAPHSAVWPFETGWAPTTGTWLDQSLRILHAEIYPSVREPLPDLIKDRGQVRAMWCWARNLDAQERFVKEFAIPPRIPSGSSDDEVIRSEEGWILGCPS